MTDGNGTTSLADMNSPPRPEPKPDVDYEDDADLVHVLPLPVKVRHSAAILGTSYFFVALCVALQAPVYPPEADTKGMPAWSYGLLFGFYYLLWAVFFPLFLYLVPEKLPTKVAIVTGLLVCGLSTTAFGYLHMINNLAAFVSVSFVLRFLEAIFSAMFQVGSDTYMRYYFGKRQSRDVYKGSFTAVHVAGVIFGPTMGGMLVQTGSFLTPFMVVGILIVVCGLVSLAVIARKLPDDAERNSIRDSEHSNYGTPQIENDVVQNDKPIENESLKKWIFAKRYIIIVASYTFLGFNLVTLEPHLRSLELTPVGIGAFFLISGIVYALLAPFFIQAITTWPVPYCVWTILGYIAIAINFLLIGPQSFLPINKTPGLIAVSLALLGVGDSLCLVAPFIEDSSNKTRLRSFASSAKFIFLKHVKSMSTAVAIGYFIGCTFGGIALSSFGYQTATLTLIGVAAILILIESISAITIASIRKKQTSITYS